MSRVMCILAVNNPTTLWQSKTDYKKTEKSDNILERENMLQFKNGLIHQSNIVSL